MKNSLTNDAVLQQLKSQFGEAILSSDNPFDLLTIEIQSSKLKDIVGWLKTNQELQINYLTNIGAVHYPEAQGRELAIVYHIHSLVNNFRIRLKAYLSIDTPEIDSIVDLYSGANWMERETFDFYGVIFKGHPNLRRILNEDSMDYFPLRKEYHLEDATREDKDDRFFGR